MIARKFFSAGVATIPFSAIAGLGALGELQHELSVYFFAVAMAMSLFFILPSTNSGERRYSLSRMHYLPRITFLATCVILLSFAANGYTIMTDVFHERHGIEKWVSSLIVIGFGFCLSYLTYFLTRDRWQNIIFFPIAVSALICAFYSVFEVLSWYGVMTGFYKPLHDLVHAGFGDVFVKWNGKLKMNLDWETRLTSVAFEPPAFGNYAGFAWPWLLTAVISSRGGTRTFYAFSFFCLNILIALAQSRTGFVMLGGTIVILCALRYAYLPPNPRENYGRVSGLITLACWCGLIGAIIAMYVNYDKAVYSVISDDNISNLTRLASQISAFAMFADYPLFGVGLGQFGFHIADYLPAWGYFSWQLRPWLIFPEAPWPAVYSIYARIGAEQGVIGLVSWISLWLWIPRKIVGVSRTYQRLTGILPHVTYPLIVSCFCVLFAGVASDTFRTPMMWITLGLACRYLGEMREFIERTAVANQQAVRRVAEQETKPNTTLPQPAPVAAEPA